ncbi:hypothetical protein F0U60_27280 [Archangium minus]|uniref:Uncharacterized protein n=1 Tax=Archangium minus TaxID=83450 RepID=A0ABY9WW90_9BACT|nr:hypothetical protein F0U60_27280 [Archangium minus]
MMKRATNRWLLAATAISFLLAVLAVYDLTAFKWDYVTEPREVPKSFQAYEDGKHRRYELLFAVNGGAFALAKLLAERTRRQFVGNLSLPHLSIGMILFTVVMVVDIFMFGHTMRTKYLPDQFATVGKTVLVLIGLLICAGWFLVAWNYEDKTDTDGERAEGAAPSNRTGASPADKGTGLRPDIS